VRRKTESQSWLALVTLLATGCAVGQPAIPLEKFVAGDLEAVRAFAEHEVASGAAENHALVLNVQAQCELLLGHSDEARRNFEAAGRIMGSWATSGGEETAAILGSESSKTYRGDPYEKAMNAFYLALCYLMKGEPDNARAACKRGILADAEVGDEKYQADNALLFWMAGRMSKLMRSPDAADFFKEATTANAFAVEHGALGDADNKLLADPERGNLVLVFECGMGPEKYADGLQHELARFRPRQHPAVAARVSLDGVSLGKAELLLDVDYQARTLGGTAMQGIRQGKAVFKTASTAAGIVLLDKASHEDGDKARTQALIGGGLLLAGLFTSSAADTRHWPTTPATVHVLTIDATAAEHSLVVEFLDARGAPIASMRQQATITVPPDGDAWYLFRSMPAPAGNAAARP
jgi:tetratricopeptide (TPR) repeat protein